MQLILTARHTTLSDEIRDLVQSRFDRLERFEKRASRAEVTVTEEKNGFAAEAVISIDRASRVHARAEAGDARSAVDRLVERLGVQLRRLHDRHHEHQAPPLDEIVAEVTPSPEGASEAAREETEEA